MPVEELGLRPLTHGMQPQEDVLQKLRRIKLPFLFIKAFVFRLDKIVHLRKGWVILRPQQFKIRLVTQAPALVQLLQHDLDHIDLPVREVLVTAEEIL